MSDVKHTPEPWALEPEFSQDHGQFSVVGPDGEEIAAVSAWIGEHRAEAKANAHLIAAAPELLSALKALHRQALQSELNDPAHEWGVEALQMASAAMAKAEGRL